MVMERLCHRASVVDAKMAAPGATSCTIPFLQRIAASPPLVAAIAESCYMHV
jgi:hypothetical protein